ncbi:hypothetical protein [Mitsuaria sp. 7]|uniref:hypothetical protein n=1 Tax=Mitsuaria sp. 7 TaxID=1658665 RepID=UPI0009EEF1A5|nr:hypothetical protein [Mitsuaria sp. 7]
MRRNILVLIALTPLATMTEALSQEFKEGQVWSYRTRSNDQGSTLLINKVEFDAKLGSIFHISVNGVKVKNRRAPNGITQDLPHFPVSRKTLEDSALKLVGTSAPNPDYREGHATWKQAFEAGEAGIFTIPVAEIVDFIEKTVNQ